MHKAKGLLQAMFVFGMTEFYTFSFTTFFVKHASTRYEFPPRSFEDHPEVFGRVEHVLVPDEHSDDGLLRPFYKDFGVTHNSMLDRSILS
jgi:hypothetical protein